MHRASRPVLDKDQPAVGKRRREANVFVIDSDLGSDSPVTELELAAIERLLGDDLARILRGTDPN
jgi:hypothetical protein